jgi:hypothetical protein
MTHLDPQSARALAQLVRALHRDYCGALDASPSEQRARLDHVLSDLGRLQQHARVLADRLADAVADRGGGRSNIRARDLARSLALELGKAGRHGYVTFGESFSVSPVVLDSLTRAEELAQRLADAADPAQVAMPGSQMPARAPLRILGLSTRILPTAHQARYAEEFRSELCELTRGGAARPRQFAYAIRQLTRAPHLHLKLRSPRRSNASR